jgi:RHS repeat-associated protein
MANLRTQVIQDNAMPVVMLGFTGAYQDPVTAFYPLGNGYRWYLPGLMRFNAPDSFSPFGAGGPNPYAYCGDDPINHTDPTGHMFRSATQIAEEEAALASESLAAKTARATEAGTSSAVPSKYVLFQDFVYPAYKNLQGVERKQLELGTATVTVHFTDIPPEEVRKSGGISPPNPKNKNQTLAFGNRMYAGDRESPYVISYKTNPGQRAMEGGSKNLNMSSSPSPPIFR